MAEDVDVLIVGAGPTGLMLALELSLQNICFRIVDKVTDRSDKSRALGVQPRSLELFNRHGDMVHDFVSTGVSGVGVNVYVNKSLAANVDLHDLGITDTAFPLTLWISQADTERLLEKRLSTYGHQVERGVTAEDIQQGESGVTVKLTKHIHNEQEQVRCKYLVGCDGAHSVVRRSPGFTFKGGAYPQAFILCDSRINWDYPHDRLMMFWGRKLLICFPVNGGITRLVGTFEPEGDAFQDPTLEDFQKLVSEMVQGPVELYDPVWLTRFRLHYRVVNKYRAGRLFVAGDAAHIHSPAGGQGMNTGFQDAVNLGWKLASVVRGEKKDEFLDSYDAERRPVGEHLLKRTDRMFSYATSANWFLMILRNFFLRWVFPIITRDRGRRAAAFGFISQLRIRYRRSPIVQTAKAFQGRPIQGGDRAADGKVEGPDGQTKMLLDLCRGSSYHVVLFSGIGLEAMGEEQLQSSAVALVERAPTGTIVHPIYTERPAGTAGHVDVDGCLHRRYGFDKPGYVIIRPDSYVGHIGLLSVMDEVLAWFDTFT